MTLVKRLKRSIQNIKLLILGDYGGILAKAGPLLPIGVYLVDQEGRFKYCNRFFREILGISEDADITKKSIADFYVYPEEREKLINKMDKDNEILLNQIIKFKKDNSNSVLYVEDNCKRHANGLPPGKFFFVGGLTDVTDIVRYQKLFDDLSAGVFRIDNDHRFIMVNKAVAKIFGYESSSEMLNMDVRKIWKNEKHFNVYINTLFDKGEVVNYPAEMLKNNGESIHISINSKLWKNDNGNIIGREGTFTDITKETKFSSAIERFSNGYYEIQNKNGKDVIINCNEMFANMHGYVNINEIIGVDIENFYYDQESRERFYSKLEKAKKENRSEIKKVIIKAKKKDGSPFWIQVDCGLKKDSSGKIIGREGVIVDITERILLENELQERQSQLKKALEDMDKFVHQYISPLMNIDSTAQTMLEILERRLSKKLEDIRHPDFIEEKTNDLINQMNEFLNSVKSDSRTDKWISFFNEKKLLLVNREERYKDPILRELWIRELVFEILEIVIKLMKTYQSDKSANHYVILKKIKNNINEICDFYILKLHRKIVDNTKITYNVIESLRRYLLFDRDTPFDFSKSNIMKIIKDNIELYYYTAKQKGLTIIPPQQDYILIEISENHIDRMFSNLILNAIKYSYQRPGGFIKIEVHETRSEIEINIENYGVPVAQDELQKVFEFGYRGKFSFEWNRTGSGIGLADAKKTVEKHDGHIHLSSKAAPNYAQKGDYSVPYLTTVTIQLPKRREKIQYG